MREKKREKSFLCAFAAVLFCLIICEADTTRRRSEEGEEGEEGDGEAGDEGGSRVGSDAEVGGEIERGGADGGRVDKGIKVKGELGVNGRESD